MGWSEFLQERKRVFSNQGKRELILLVEYWPLILLGAVPQLLHSVFTKLAYYLYSYYGVDKQPILVDLGFNLFGELGIQYHWMSELITFGTLAALITWCLVPFVVERKDFYAIFVLRRYLLVVAYALVIRCVSFLITVLPSPGAQCRHYSADYNPPTNFIDIMLHVDAVNGCADLIFSSHTAYTVTTALTYYKYGRHMPLKIFGFMLCIVLGCLIVALHKHYSVDVWLAWNIMPLVWFLFHVKLQDKVPDALVEFEKTISNPAAAEEQKVDEEMPNLAPEDSSELNRENSDRRLLESA